MINGNRRSFLKGLGALGAGLVVDPMLEPLIVPERKKIWVVGAQLSAPMKFKFPSWDRGGYVIAAASSDELGLSEEQLLEFIRQDEQQHVQAALERVVRDERSRTDHTHAFCRIPVRQEMNVLPAYDNVRAIGWVIERNE